MNKKSSNYTKILFSSSVLLGDKISKQSVYEARFDINTCPLAISNLIMKSGNIILFKDSKQEMVFYFNQIHSSLTFASTKRTRNDSQKSSHSWLMSKKVQQLKMYDKFISLSEGSKKKGKEIIKKKESAFFWKG